MTRAVTWLSEQTDGDRMVFRIGRQGERLVADFGGLAQLCADRSGASSSFEPADGADPVVIEKLKNGLVPALLRHLRRELTLHGAAVTMGGRAFVFSGASRAGKSTLAARLCNANGAALMADDSAAVDFEPGALMVRLTERVHWLVSGRDDPDPLGDTKYPVAPRAVAGERAPLAMVCRVRFDDALEAPVVTRLRGHGALEALVPTVIRFAIDDPRAHLREAAQLDELVRSVPVYDFARPHGEIARGVEWMADLAHRTLRGEA